MALEKLRTEISALEQKRDDLISEIETIEKESKAEFEKCNHEIEDISLAIEIALINEEIEKLDTAIEELAAIFERMKSESEYDARF